MARRSFELWDLLKKQIEGRAFFLEIGSSTFYPSDIEYIPDQATQIGLCKRVFLFNRNRI